jgi:protein-S-isoprenylcysteine O-methyltransferase Ste14
MLHMLRVLALNLLLSLLVIVVCLLAFMADRFWNLSLPGQLELLAWPLLLLGLLLILAAEYSLLSAGRGSGAPGNRPSKLVTSGLYGWVRNPVYLGTPILLFGVACFHRSPSLLLMALIFIPAIHVYVVRIEEPRTARRLGAEYARYKQNVPRWLPRPPRRKNDQP